MKKHVSVALLSVILVSAAAPAFAQDCTCRYQTEDIPEGKVVCMQTNNGNQMAQCVKVLNNTSWKFLGTPCPTARIKDKTAKG